MIVYAQCGDIDGNGEGLGVPRTMVAMGGWMMKIALTYEYRQMGSEITLYKNTAQFLYVCACVFVCLFVWI